MKDGHLDTLWLERKETDQCFNSAFSGDCRYTAIFGRLHGVVVYFYGSPWPFELVYASVRLYVYSLAANRCDLAGLYIQFLAV